jgi:hypothetical protein
MEQKYRAPRSPPHEEDENLAEKLTKAEEISPANGSRPRVATQDFRFAMRSGLVVDRVRRLP